MAVHKFNFGYLSNRLNCQALLKVIWLLFRFRRAIFFFKRITFLIFIILFKKQGYFQNKTLIRFSKHFLLRKSLSNIGFDFSKYICIISSFKISKTSFCGGNGKLYWYIWRYCNQRCFVCYIGGSQNSRYSDTVAMAVQKPSSWPLSAPAGPCQRPSSGGTSSCPACTSSSRTRTGSISVRTRTGTISGRTRTGVGAA